MLEPGRREEIQQEETAEKEEAVIIQRDDLAQALRRNPVVIKRFHG